MLMTDPSTGSLASNLPASGDGLCRVDITNAARRRFRASRNSTSANFARCGRLYKTEAVPRLSRELLVRAVAYRMQEVASGGPRLELQRQLRQIGLELQQTGRLRIRPQLKPGTRISRRWRGVDSNFWF